MNQFLKEFKNQYLVIIFTYLNFSRLKLILFIGYICIAIPTMNFDKNSTRFENKKNYLCMNCKNGLKKYTQIRSFYAKSRLSW